jgi:hypothetical protein
MSIQIFIKILSGKKITLNVDASDTIETIKSMIQEEQGIRASDFKLAFAGKLMENNHTLSDYDIQRTRYNLSFVYRPLEGG